MTKEDSTYEHLATKLREKFESLGIADIKVTLENGSNAGDGYLSDVVRAEVTGTKDGVEQYIDTVIKRATKDNKLRTNLPTVGPFKHEIFVYTEVVPMYEKLQNDFGIQNEFKVRFAKCYGANDQPYEEFIILENLKPQNFKMAERLNIDYKHASVAIDTLAKLHALSYAFERIYPEKFQSVVENYGEVLLVSRDSEYDPKILQEFHKTCVKKAVACIKNDKIRAKLDKATHNLYEDTVIAAKGGARRVLCHGDFWSNNIFYKYKNGEPTEVILIDYQLARYASPVIDISFLMWCCTDAEFRRDHYHKLLEQYYSTLRESLKRLSLDADDVYPKEIFQKELAEYSKFGLNFAIYFMVAFLEPNSSDLLEVFTSTHKYEMKPASEKRMNDLAADYFAYGYV